MIPIRQYIWYVQHLYDEVLNHVHTNADRQTNEPMWNELSNQIRDNLLETIWEHINEYIQELKLKDD